MQPIELNEHPFIKEDLLPEIKKLKEQQTKTINMNYFLNYTNKND